MAKDKQHKIPNAPTLRFPEFTGEWVEIQLAEILDKLENGATYNPNDTEGYPMSRIETISSGKINYEKTGRSKTLNAEHYLLHYGDILFSHINSLSHIGRTAYYDAAQPLYHGMNLLLLRCKSDYNSRFVFQLLNTERFLLKCKVLAKQAVNQASISTKDVGSIRIHIPSEAEQDKIDRFLTLIDDRIQTQIGAIDKLESLISALYAVLLSKAKSNIPLSDICKVKKGQQINGDCLSDVGKYYVMNGGVEPSGYFDQYNTEAETISISEGGNSCGYVQYNRVRFWSSGHCYTLHPMTDNINSRYLYHFLKSKQPDIMKLRIGSGLPNIQKKDIETFPIGILSLKQQQQIVSILDTIDSKIDVERQLLDCYRQQKQYLLSQMFV